MSTPDQAGPLIATLGASDQERESAPDEYQGFHGRTDHNPKLRTWRQKVERFDEQRLGHAESAAQLLGLKLPVTRADWRVLPGEVQEDASEQEREAAQLAADVVSSMLFGTPWAEYRINQAWEKILNEALTCLDFGPSFSERAFEWRDGPGGRALLISDLWWIHPRSVWTILRDKNGALLGLWQLATRSYWNEAGEMVSESVNTVIPAQDLVAVVRQQEGANWEGVALLRHMFGAADRHGYLTRVRANEGARRGSPPPIANYTGDGTPGKEAQDQAEALAKRLATGSAPERSYGVTTDGWEVGFMEMKGTPPDLTRMIESEEESIRAVSGREFTTSTGGSMARAVTQARYFDLHVQSIAELVRSALQEQVVKIVSDMNWPGVPTPQLSIANLVPRDLETVEKMVGANALVLTGDVVQTIHEALGLPALEPEVVEELNANPLNIGNATPAEDAPAPPPSEDDDDEPPPDDEQDDEPDDDEATPPGEMSSPGVRGRLQIPPAPAGAGVGRFELAEGEDEIGVGGVIGRPTWREPTEFERAVVNLSAVDRGYDRFTVAFTQAVVPVRDQMIEAYVGKLQVSGRRVSKPRGAMPGRKKLIGTMAPLSDGMRAFGNEQAKAEIARQENADPGDIQAPEVQQPLLDEKPAGERAAFALNLETVVDEVAETIVSALELDADKLMAQIANTSHGNLLAALMEGIEEAEARDEATLRTKEMSTASVERAGRNQASIAYNGGKSEAFAEAAVDLVVRTEVLDAATCGPCRDLDGTVVNVDSPDYDRLEPPNECEGGSNCRGFYTPIVMTAEQAGAVGRPPEGV